MNILLLVTLSLLSGVNGDYVKPCPPCLCRFKNGTTQAVCSSEMKVTGLSHILTDIQRNIGILYFRGQQFRTLNNNDFNTFNNLTKITVRECEVETIEPETFQNTTTLKELWIVDNRIQNLPNGVFDNLKKITMIFLQYNNITHLQTKLFSELPYLETVSFWENDIETIEDDCFYNLPSLKEVSLQHNKLKVLHTSITNIKSNLKYFRLHDNPWRCDEELCPFMHYVLNSTLNELICSSPTNLQRNKWAQALKQFMPRVSNDQENLEGSNASLQCQYCFEAEIKWNFNNGTLSRHHNIEKEIINDSIVSTLTLNNVTQNDSGLYSCILEDRSGYKEASVVLNVTQLTETQTATNYYLAFILIPVLVIVIIIGWAVFYVMKMRQKYSASEWTEQDMSLAMLSEERTIHSTQAAASTSDKRINSGITIANSIYGDS